MRVAIIQSSYIPWSGYFQIAFSVDTFVFYDEVQFTKNDWRNRNRIVGKNGEFWLTIPVNHQFGQSISDTRINGDYWRNKHLKSIYETYIKAPHFDKYYDLISKSIQVDRFLSVVNQRFLKAITPHFGSAPDWVDSSIFPVSDCKNSYSECLKTDRLCQILHQLGASTYITGPRGLDYLKGSALKKIGVDLEVFNYFLTSPYGGSHREFSNFVSAIDPIFHLGLIPQR